MPTFRTQQALWYNAGVWGKLGYAVPNFGMNPTTENQGIAYLANQIGKALFGVLNTPDTDLTSAPSLNTLTRVNKLIIRARSILASRAVPSGEPLMEGTHTMPDQIDFLIFPVPYFSIRNPWIKEWAGFALTALAEAMQHTENRRAFDFSVDFSKIVSQYFQRIYVRMAVELLQIPLATASADTFVISEAQLAAYNPSAFLTSTEQVDVAPTNPLEPSPYDLQFLANGIPAKNLVGLCLWPNGDAIPVGIPDAQQPANSSGATASTVGASGTSAAPAVPAFPGSPSS